MQRIRLENSYFSYHMTVTEQGRLRHESFLPAGYPRVPEPPKLKRIYPCELALSFAESRSRGWRFADAEYWDEASDDLLFKSCTQDGPLTVITLEHPRLQIEVQLCYVVYADSPALQRYTRVINRSDRALTLQHVSSFMLSGFPYFADAGSLYLHSFSSGWACEGEQQTEPFSALGLLASGCRSCWSFENNSAFSTQRRFPYFVVEERGTGLFWGVQIESGSQWRAELGGGDVGNPNWFYLQGGLLNFSGALWSKTLQPGEVFETPRASMTVAAGTIDDIFNQMHTHQKNHFIRHPKQDETLPVIFNDWQAMRGTVSERLIHDQLRSLQELGVEIYVTDSGWYHEDGQDWSEYVGCWSCSRTRFPNGLSAVAADIAAHGMIAGIWCEIEMVGPHSPIYQDADMLLTCNGQFITQGFRRFLDFRRQRVREHADRVIEMLYGSGFRYLKIDYNADCCPGCDGEDGSIVENLRQARLAYGSWLAGVLERRPDLILEHCASGGLKLDYDNLTRGSLASITDQWDPRHTGSILCNVTRLVHPTQCENWSTLRPDMDPDTMEFVLTNSMMGRMCLSGVLSDFTPAQKALVKKGVDFYRRWRSLIADPLIFYHAAPCRVQEPENLKIMEYLHDDVSMVYISAHDCAGDCSFTPRLQEFMLADAYPCLNGITVSGSAVSAELSAQPLFGRVLILKKTHKNPGA